MRILILSMSICIICYNHNMFCDRLKELRKERGITQQELSNALDCSQSMIARWEKGECDATGAIIVKLALYFNVTADYLLGLTD